MKYEQIDSLPMEICYTKSGVRGYIELSKMAIPFTVRVVVNGREIIPNSFDDFGNPYFTEEQITMYLVENFYYKEATGSKENLKVQVKYRVSNLYASKRSFDTVQGIEKALTGLRELNLVLSNRRRFLKLRPEQELNEFVVFGQFLLGKKGEVLGIRQCGRDKLIVKAPVVTFEEFLENNKDRYILDRGFSSSGMVIPKTNSTCPCCGKTFTIYDLHDGYCVCIGDKTYHENCYNYYKKCDELLETGIELASQRRD